LLLANAANYATAQADRRNFYELTIIPEADLVARTINEQLLTAMGLALVFRPEAMSIFQADEAQRASAFSSYTSGGLKPSIAAQLLGITLPEGVEYADLDPEPVAMAPAANEVPAATPENEGDDAPVDDKDDDDEEKAKEAKRLELERFRRWAAKRASPDVAKFVSELLSDDDKRRALHWHADAEGTTETSEVKATPVIDWLGEGADNYRAMKAMVLQLDPDDDEAERAIREALERRIEKNLREGFNEMVETLFPSGYGDWRDPAKAADWAHQQWRMNDAMEKKLKAALYDSVSLGVNVSLDLMEQVGISFDYTMVMDEALEWAKAYSYELITGIEATGKEVVSRAVARFIETGKPLEDLAAELAKIYSEPRAAMIASTETTRAFFEGQAASFRSSGVIQKMEWRTSRDERVCPICGPLHGKRAKLGEKFSGAYTPPAHPRCRCWIAPVVERTPQEQPA